MCVATLAPELPAPGPRTRRPTATAPDSGSALHTSHSAPPAAAPSAAAGSTRGATRAHPSRVAANRCCATHPGTDAAASKYAAPGSTTRPATQWSQSHPREGRVSAASSATAGAPPPPGDAPSARPACSSGWLSGATQHLCSRHTWPATCRTAPLPEPARRSSCARRACALVPWNAKELAPPTRPSAPGRPDAARCRGTSHARCNSAPCAPPTRLSCRRALAACRCITGHTSVCVRLRTLCSKPVTPAAGSVCPTLLLPACSTSGAPLTEAAPLPLAPLSSTWLAAPTSMGSPRDVAVPCSCRCTTALGGRRAPRRACSRTRCCAGPLGAVRALERPSWLTPLPTTAAAVALAVPSAPSSALRRLTAPHASPRPYPSAEESSVLHRPSAASMPACLNTMHVSGVSVRFVPATRAAAQSCCRRPWQERWVPTSDDEHAVSTLRDGPRQSNANESRPAATLSALPVAAYGLTSSQYLPRSRA